MSRIEQIAAQARERGIRPWIAAKELLASEVIHVLAGDDRAVLQGGAALHFGYGSPRLSADVDFVGPAVAGALADAGAAVAAAAERALGAPARWSLERRGRLLRGKVTLEIDAARRLVLPIEAYEVPAHRARSLGGLGLVEEPVEIAADKIVASASRLAVRGTLKTRDLYDLWFLRARVGVDAPDRELVLAKAHDYGEPRRGLDLAAAVRAVQEEELREALEGVLPASELPELDARAIIDEAAKVVGGYSELL